MGFSWLVNPRFTPGPSAVLDDAGYAAARAAITAWPGYAPTRLVPLPAIAAEAGIGALHLKDESGRFGLGSFKALGGAYAVARQAGLHGKGITVTCATDGNHGRSVAWGAARAGCRAVIFVHETVSQGRVEAIAAFGAEVRRVPGNYDDAVRRAAETAAREGWIVVSDTSYPGYDEIPRDVMQGYRLMAEEALAALPAPPTHIFVQAGVGGIAAAAAAQAAIMAPAARVIVAEPDRASCLLASARSGQASTLGGALDTIMAGLACGEPSLLAWQDLDRRAFAFAEVPDDDVAPLMRRLAAGNPRVEAGESAVAGLAVLLRAAADPRARAAFGLDRESQALVFSTEGATDPALYAELVGTAGQR
ncbi:MAG: diaminopropionate ammonia-lyase [Acetobacteraceae bacterium]|nr:diaminopropionate ammonia-lyase [Acetobacteraceae bacterium]